MSVGAGASVSEVIVVQECLEIVPYPLKVNLTLNVCCGLYDTCPCPLDFVFGVEFREAFALLTS